MNNAEIVERTVPGLKRIIRIVDIPDSEDNNNELQDIMKKGMMIIPDDQLHHFSRGLYSPPK